MIWFKKKGKENTPTPIIESKSKECQHIWWDSSPYIEFNWTCYYNEYNRRREKEKQLGKLTIQLIESYVCCNCGKRNDEILQEIKIEDITRNQGLIEAQRIKNEYKNFCKPRAKVEDEINDLKYKIDRNLLQTIGVYQPQKLGSTFSSTSQLPILETFLKEKNNG